VPLRDAELTRIVERRTRFLTGRYADHAPYWQFVKWSWMICLILDALLANTILTAIDDRTSAGYILASLSHALVAMIILGCAWRVHYHVHPYEFAVQNYVEHLLFFSDIVLVFFGAVYTLLLYVSPTCAPAVGASILNGSLVGELNATADGITDPSRSCMPPAVRTLLEVVMMTLLVGAILAATSFLVHSYCTGRMDVTQTQFDMQLDMRRKRGMSVLAALSTWAHSERSSFVAIDSGAASSKGADTREAKQPARALARTRKGLQKIDEDGHAEGGSGGVLPSSSVTNALGAHLGDHQPHLLFRHI
jgi:hypothetical protein